MHYTEAGREHRGERPTLVLLHGLGGSRRQWGQVQDLLASTTHTIALDIPGFGESRGRWRQFEVGRASEEICQFCRTLEISDAVLVSHSIASVVAGNVAVDCAQTFSTVVLLSGALYRASAIAQRPQSALRDPAFGAVVATQFLAGSVPVTAPLLHALARVPLLRRIALFPFVRRPDRIDPEHLRRALEGAGSLAVAKILVQAGGIDYQQIFANIPQPVHLIWGANDRLIDASDVEQARRDMRVVAEHVLPDCGHWPMIEFPDEVVRLLREIVDE